MSFKWPKMLLIKAINQPYLNTKEGPFIPLCSVWILFGELCKLTKMKGRFSIFFYEWEATEIVIWIRSKSAVVTSGILTSFTNYFLSAFRWQRAQAIKVCTIPPTESQWGCSKPELSSQVPPELSGNLERPAALNILHIVQESGCDRWIWAGREHRPISGNTTLAWSFVPSK